MSWQITKDHIAAPDDVSREGWVEDHGRIPAVAVMIGEQSPELPTTDVDGNELAKIKFRMYDDDGELYYEGELHDDTWGDNQLAALRFGEGDAGCTTIKVLRAGEWVQEIG